MGDICFSNIVLRILVPFAQIGEAGLAQHVGNYKNTVYDLKGVLGGSWSDQEFSADVRQLAYKVLRSDDDRVLVFFKNAKFYFYSKNYKYRISLNVFFLLLALFFIFFFQIEVQYGNETITMSPEQVTGALFTQLKLLAELGLL